MATPTVVSAGAPRLTMVTLTVPDWTTLKVPVLKPRTASVPENVSVSEAGADGVESDGEVGPGGRKQPAANTASPIA